MSEKTDKSCEQLTLEQKIKILEMSLKIGGNGPGVDFKTHYRSMVDLITKEEG